MLTFFSKIIFLFAFLVGTYLVWRCGRDHDFDEEKILDWVIWGTLIATIGARLVYVGFHWSDYLLVGKSLAEILRSLLTISDGGLYFEGAIYTFLLFTFALFHRWHWPLVPPLDFFALGASLAHFLFAFNFIVSQLLVSSVSQLLTYSVLPLLSFLACFLIYHRYYKEGRILSLYLFLTLKPLLVLTGILVFYKVEGWELVSEFVSGLQQGIAETRKHSENQEKDTEVSSV